MKKAEVYYDFKNSWKNLPDMPEAVQEITCVKVNNQILISGLDFRLISYEIDNIAYTYVG